MIKGAKKLAAGVVLLAFLAIGVLGMSMPMSDGGGHAMPFDCPFMQGGSLCQMTFTDHLAHWKRLTNAPVSPSFDFALLMLAVMCAVVVWSGFLGKPLNPRFIFGNVSDRWRGFVWKLKFWVQRAFARGILNPKIW